MGNMKPAVVQELRKRGNTPSTNLKIAHAVCELSSSSTHLGQATDEAARNHAGVRNKEIGDDHPAIVNELAASLRRMLLLYEDRALRRTCDRWEQEARDVLARLPAPAPNNVVFGKDMKGNAEERARGQAPNPDASAGDRKH